jgi:endoglycosylceramidase
MGGRLDSILLLVALTGAVGCGGEDTAAADPPGPDGWHVARGFLRAPDGRAAILRGVNLAGSHKSAPYFGFHQAEDFARVRQDWGMGAIRFLILWAAIEPQEGQYDDSYLDEVQKRLDWAEDAGLKVVLDMHQDLYGEGFGGDGAPSWTCDQSHYDAYEPITPWFLNYLNEHITACIDGFWHDEELQGHYIEAWRQVAARFADHPAVVGFDPMNEPYWGSTSMNAFEDEVLRPFYVEVVGAIRAQAPGWVAFLEPAASRNLGLPTGLTPFPFDHVVYAPHSYDNDAEGGAGFDPAKRDAILADVANLAAEAEALGAALWVGEYGGMANTPGIQPYMDAQYDAIAAVVGGSAYWAYDRSDGYGMLDPQGNEKPELLEVLVRPYPELVAGEPVRVAFDEDSSTFTFEWKPDGSGLATELSVPERVYPNGYQVDCAGCQVDEAPGRLLVTATGSSAQLVLVPAGG